MLRVQIELVSGRPAASRPSCARRFGTLLHSLQNAFLGLWENPKQFDEIVPAERSDSRSLQGTHAGVARLARKERHLSKIFVFSQLSDYFVLALVFPNDFHLAGLDKVRTKARLSLAHNHFARRVGFDGEQMVALVVLVDSDARENHNRQYHQQRTDGSEQEQRSSRGVDQKVET